MKNFKKKITFMSLLSAMSFAIQGHCSEQYPYERLDSSVTIKQDMADRVFLMDSVFMHLTESRLNVFDVKTGKFLGMVPTSFNGHAKVDVKRKKIYVMTTYYDRVTRGNRSDVVEIWDADSLSFEKEIKIPPKRAQALNYKNIIQQTTDGKFLLIQNATPAMSVSVVNLDRGLFVNEITATAGCWSVNNIANKPNGFFSICGDGSILVIELDKDGNISNQIRSNAMFNPDVDPIFIVNSPFNNKYYFVSFNGNIYSAEIKENDIVIDSKWSFLDEKGIKENWKPGGYNLFDIDNSTGLLYVLMHSNAKEGSHKFPSEEIWVIDLNKKVVVSKIPAENYLSLSVQQNKKLLFATDASNLYIYKIADKNLNLLNKVEKAGEAALEIITVN